MRKRAGVQIAVAGVLLASGLIAAESLLNGDGSGGSVGSTPPAGPIPGEVHTIALRDLPTGAGGAREVGTPASGTKPYSMLGVTWDQKGSPPPGNVRVRTRSAGTGEWSSWRTVAVNTEEAPDAQGREHARQRGGTDPLWVGPSNGVEVRMAGSGGPVPAGLRVDLVDPGAARAHAGGARAALAADETTPDPSATPADIPADPTPEGPVTPPSDPPADPPPDIPADSAPPADVPGDPTTPAPSAGPESSAPAAPEPPSPAPASQSPSPASPRAAAGAASTAPLPAIVGRAQWGADESIVRQKASYDQVVKAVFVHHTDTGNSYTCAQSASVVRSIMLYHVQSEGWDDIGYNFLVDKCGTIFEGRAGGMDRPVHGAHTYGFNTDSTGVAVLGTYTAGNATPAGVAPARQALDGVAKISAWKLGLDKRDPAAKVQLVSNAPNGTGGKYPFGTMITFNAISGHRDGFATECPGSQLYAQLAAIRTQAHQLAIPDTTRPVFTSPAGLALRGGTVSTTWVPIWLGWRATDDQSLRSVKITASSTANVAATASSWSGYTRVGRNQNWTVSATDGAGNTATSSVARKAGLASETSSSRSKGWKTTSGSAYLGGKALSSASKGNSITWKVTGRSIGLIAKRASNLGAFTVYVDGKKAGTVDTRARYTAYRQIVWTKTWGGTGKHTIKIVLAGTRGRGTVITDGLAYLS